MLDSKKVLALIPARGGSKAVPGKNIKLLGGKPLIAWTIEAAKGSRYIDRLILSSDDSKIISVARAWGCEVPFTRPAELATDDAPGIAPVLHAVSTIEESYDYLVLLQPTSPFRTTDDIDKTIELCILNHAVACVSVTKSAKHPAWMYYLSPNNQLSPFFQDREAAATRQQLPPVYALNGAVYITETTFLLDKKILVPPNQALGYPMPEERSFDIDTPFDFKLCDLIAKDLGYY